MLVALDTPDDDELELLLDELLEDDELDELLLDELELLDEELEEVLELLLDDEELDEFVSDMESGSPPQALNKTERAAKNKSLFMKSLQFLVRVVRVNRVASSPSAQ